jgi:hypothetical protein
MESFYPASTRPLPKSHPRSKPPPLEATAAGTRPTSHPTATHQPKNPAEGIQKSHHQGRSLPPQLPSLLRHGQQAPAGGTLARSLPPTCATPDKHTTPTRLPRHTPHPDAHHWHNLAHTSSKHSPNTATRSHRGQRLQPPVVAPYRNAPRDGFLPPLEAHPRPHATKNIYSR